MTEDAYGADSAFHSRTLFLTRGELLRRLWLAERCIDTGPPVGLAGGQLVEGWDGNGWRPRS